MREMIMQAEPRLLVVVVTHNGSPWLGHCLKALRRQVYPRLDLVVVDNGSQQPATATVARYAPGTEFIWSEHNLGFGAACNAGLEASTKTAAADYFLFLHDDVVLDPTAASLLVAAALDTDAGVIGGKGLRWDDPHVLVEVGMSADQFCFPFSGLEEGEIDQGQHEDLAETLFVTNACMLVSRGLAERCGLWDGAYFALGEDLDLCLRARLTGFKVMVQPAARFRHAMALSNDLRTVTPSPPRKGMLTRRNQLRTIAKNFSGPRMAFLLGACLLVGLVRTIVLVAFRRFDEVADYPRAVLEFARSLPNVMLRRRAVQKRRMNSDRRLRRFMVRDSRRIRLELERRLQQWEGGTLAFGARTFSKISLSSIKQELSGWIRQPLTMAAGLVVLLALFAMRNVVFGDPVAGGTLWPFPESTGRFMGDFVSGWRDMALGTESAAPAAFPLLWLAGILGFGRPGLAQKLLIAVLVGLGLYGVNRLVKSSVAFPPARLLAMAFYALNPVLHAMVSGGDLGALAMYAGLPFILQLVLRFLGSGSPAGDSPEDPGLRAAVPPSVDGLATALARLALILIPVVALGPSSLVSLTVMLGSLGIGAGLLAGAYVSAIWRRFRFMLLSVPLAALLLVPWSLEGLRPDGAILAPLFSGPAGAYYPLWSRLGFQQMFLLNLDGRAGALVTLGVIAGALLLTGEARRAEARLLSLGLITFALLGGFASKGILPVPVASPTMWLAVPLVLVAAMAGHLVAGIQEELPRHAFGWRHKVAIPAVGLTVTAGVLIGWAPQLPEWRRPEPTFAAGTGQLGASIASFLQSTASQEGEFRVLWLGTRWTDPVRSGIGTRQGADYFLTGADGLSLLDAYRPPATDGEKRLDGTVRAMMGLRLHLAGRLLAPASIRFIVADPKDSRSIDALVRQRDVVLEQQQGGVAIFRNLQWLPRASLVPPNLNQALTAQADPTKAMMADWSGAKPVAARSPSRFTAALPGPGYSQVLLSYNYNSGWRASVGSRRLERARAFGWANRFLLGTGAGGTIKIYYAGDWIRAAWLVLQVVLLATVLAMARARNGGGRKDAV